jgi:hypothetical protein
MGHCLYAHLHVLSLHVVSGFLMMFVLGVRVVIQSYLASQAHLEFFVERGGADPEAIYNLCLILKTVLWRLCQNLRVNI